MFPDAFLKRIEDQKTIDSKALIGALREPSPVSIRVNPLKWNKFPLITDPVPWCETGFYLEARPSFTLDPLFHSGGYYPQEASSMFVEQVFKQIVGYKENIRVLDLCGAPGGKSTHISGLLSEGSMLVANDVIRSRASILAETITKWGSENTLVTQNDPAQFGKLSGYFDIILVDAPCSGEGMFRDISVINEWSRNNTIHCSVRQKRILADVWPALKQDGILVYSTCTFNPGENEENIKWLTGKYESVCEKVDVTGFQGIKEIDYQGIYGYGFYPDKVRGDGFFISVIRKTGEQEQNITRSKKNNIKPCKQDLEIVVEWSQFSVNRLLKRGEEIFAVPCNIDEYFNLVNNLNIVKNGTKLFTVKQNDYLPSPQLALSTKLRKDSFHGIELDLDMAISYLRRDRISFSNMPEGWNTVSYKGLTLGFVNNLGNRINNYFPVEWRIRMSKPDDATQNIIRWSNGSKQSSSNSV